MNPVEGYLAIATTLMFLAGVIWLIVPLRKLGVRRKLSRRIKGRVLRALPFRQKRAA
ncbi:MAG: hypothetical protein LAO03_00245 [Acidobacteriia bacterium]|nr:hypothetical protein [Terriglobia bacterium]